MREVKLGDGKILHMPDTEQRTMLPRQERDDHGYTCECHRTLGNDFWFLPIGSCLRKDRECNR
jgi:hypothetical protein